jgi:hypothetical protein
MIFPTRRVAATPPVVARMARAATRAAALAIAAGATSVAGADESPSAVPYRPSVSTPAALSAPGWLEVEGGYLHEHAESGALRQSVPLTLKLAFTPDWGIRVASDAWVRLRDESGEHATGSGDTAIVVKRRFAVDDDSAFGLEGGVTLPTSRHGLGIGNGKPDWVLNAIYSADFGAWHTDLNAAATRFGDTQTGTSRAQLLAAASLSRSLDEHWGVAGELSGTGQHGADSTRQLLVAASYNVSKRLVIDAGAARTLRSGAPSWSAFTGFTWLATRIF